MSFNQSISLEIFRTVQHLSDFVLSPWLILPLARRDAYLDHLRSGINPETALQTAHLQMSTLFPDSVQKKAEDDVSQYES